MVANYLQTCKSIRKKKTREQIFGNPQKITFNTFYLAQSTMPVLGEEMARIPVQAGSSSDIPLVKKAHSKIQDFLFEKYATRYSMHDVI